MTPRIEKAINIFLDAINDGTLASGTCAACAVGNLVAAGYGIKPKIHESYNEYSETIRQEINSYWPLLINHGNRNRSFFNEIQALDNISKTDFTIDELRKIERAFEYNADIAFDRYKDRTKEEIRTDQINGLSAVVKVMLEFDDCKDTVKEVFIDKAELIPIK